MNLIINELIYLLTSTLLHGQEMMTTIQRNTETVAVGDIYDKGTSALSSDPHSTAAMSSFMKVLKYVHLLKNCRNNCLYTAWLLTTLYLVDLCRPVSSIDGHWHLRSTRRGQLDVPRVRTVNVVDCLLGAPFLSVSRTMHCLYLTLGTGSDISISRPTSTPRVFEDFCYS